MISLTRPTFLTKRKRYWQIHWLNQLVWFHCQQEKDGNKGKGNSLEVSRDEAFEPPWPAAAFKPPAALRRSPLIAFARRFFFNTFHCNPLDLVFTNCHSILIPKLIPHRSRGKHHSLEVFLRVALSGTRSTHGARSGALAPSSRLASFPQHASSGRSSSLPLSTRSFEFVSGSVWNIFMIFSGRFHQLTFFLTDLTVLRFL